MRSDDHTTIWPPGSCIAQIVCRVPSSRQSRETQIEVSFTFFRAPTHTHTTHTHYERRFYTHYCAAQTSDMSINAALVESPPKTKANRPERNIHEWPSSIKHHIIKPIDYIESRGLNIYLFVYELRVDIMGFWWWIVNALTQVNACDILRCISGGGGLVQREGKVDLLTLESAR